MIEINGNYIKIDTLNTSLIFKVEKCSKKPNGYNVVEYNHIAILYYGSKIKTHNNYDLYNKSPMLIDRVGGATDDYLKARFSYSTPGMGMNKEVSLIVDNVNKTNVNRFEFSSAKIIDGGIEFDYMPYARKGKQTLELTLKDKNANLTLIQNYTIFDDCDVIAVCQKLINNNKESIYIKKIASLQLDLPDEEWNVCSFDGTWGGERYRHTTNLKSGCMNIDSKTGSSSMNHNPFFIIEGQGVNDNKYAFNFIYSGSHKEQIEISPYGATRVLVGINDYLLNYEVKGGEYFETPQAIMVTSKNLDDITSNMHEFTLNHIINSKYNNYERPVLYNHWEGTGIDFNEELLLELADIASDVGVELFVMDDGWFGERFDDLTSLGDWYVNKQKFPNGLKSLSENIKKRNMKFGIWIEPEMISIKSNIYKTHPEFAVEIPGVTPIQRRNQLIIDMTNPKVIEYLYDCLTKVFDECKPDYVKWDYNRVILDTYSHANFKSGEFYHKMMLGSYKLMSLLTSRYPNTLFEGCSSGGNRFDLGICFYMPQSWGSDDTNSIMRTYIQCGTLTAYPQSTFGAHVTQDHCNYASRRSSIEDRFNLNCIGAFGYEFDFRKFNEKELSVMKKQVEFYKEHRNLLQYGKYICLDNIFDNGNHYSYMVVSKDRSEAMVTVIEKEYLFGKNPKLYKLKGLDKDALYLVTQRPQANVKVENELSFTAYGDALMNYGVDFGYLADVTDKDEYGGLKSRMFYIKKI